MTDVTIRHAREADLPEVYDVFYENEVADDPNPPPPGEIPALLKHELATGEMAVAQRDGRIVAFASLITRGSIAYLAELFVRPGQQSAHLGTRLLHHVLPKDGRICCTLSSRDPRALALYVRAGMRPQWPNLWLRAHTARLGALPRGEVAVVAARPDDAELLRWDTRISGRHRAVDLQYWSASEALPVWFERRGRRVGYGYIQTRGGSLWFPEAITIGPVGTDTSDDAFHSVCAAVEFARPRAAVVRLAVPGPHPS